LEALLQPMGNNLKIMPLASCSWFWQPQWQQLLNQWLAKPLPEPDGALAMGRRLYGFDPIQDPSVEIGGHSRRLDFFWK
jgi:hypothetical protein